MLFNSLDFAIFLPVVFLIYWFIARNNIRWQNILIVAASYTFYGWWDWRFLSLILFSTIVDFVIGNALKQQQSLIRRRFLLWTSISVNLGLLAFFKYFNFFLDNVNEVFSFLGHPININGLNIILPVGISFYTFQTLSYSIDVYKRNLTPTNDFIAFAAFVSFFPQLVAGPIERATNLLPQFYSKRSFDYSSAVDGMRQILWGLFKKIVIADNCAQLANLAFGNYESYSGVFLFLGAIFFTFQIYGDFSGYSDIAIGTARLFGFNLMRNFAFPYFSRDIAEFWRNWHISLSTWFRDYVYVPLGGSRGNLWLRIRNTFIIFIVSGFWHGANWTFIFWGALNAIYFLPLLLLKRNRKNIGVPSQNRFLPSIREFSGILSTFMLTVLAWIFFRANNIGHAFQYLKSIFTNQHFNVNEILQKDILLTLLFVFVLLIVEWLNRDKQYGIQILENNFLAKKPLLRYSMYFLLILIIVNFGGGQQDFIYFQF